MDRLTDREWREASVIAFDEGTFASIDQAATWVRQVEGYARELHGLYVRECNTGGGSRTSTRIDTLEGQLREAFKAHDLGLYLNGDPRGNPVGILTPKTGKSNTMGGASAGWRL